MPVLVAKNLKRFFSLADTGGLHKSLTGNPFVSLSLVPRPPLMSDGRQVLH